MAEVEPALARNARAVRTLNTEESPNGTAIRRRKVSIPTLSARSENADAGVAVLADPNRITRSTDTIECSGLLVDNFLGRRKTHGLRLLDLVGLVVTKLVGYQHIQLQVEDAIPLVPLRCFPSAEVGHLGDLI